MAKSNTLFACEACGSQFPKWQGQCDQCGEWNSLVEETAPVKSGGGFGKKRSAQVYSAEMSEKVVSLPEVKPLSYAKFRLSTGIGELDRVLGGQYEAGSGGMVPGAVMLIGGEPGIGKSTLLTQMVVGLFLTHHSPPPPKKNKKNDNVKKSAKNSADSAKPETEHNNFSILYVCGEESPSQISLRIKRILENEHKVTDANFGSNSAEDSLEAFLFCTSTDVDEIAQLVEKHRPSVLIVDSIQTVSTQDLSGAAGSAGQIRESADRITTVVKRLHIPTFLVGHVTKEGVIAGPKILEHIVDSVLELSGERTGDLRVLRAVKNRFGATDEVGVFKMNEWGLEEVSNPSQLFLEHAEQSVPGSATVCVMEGTRPLMVEVQALVVGSQLAMPRRVGRGIELSRIQVLSAILQKHCKLPLGSSDVFLSAVGGLKVKEPAADLGLAVALASSLKGKPLPSGTVWIGEIGLLGEVRKVSHQDKRIKEAKRLGFKNIISRENYQRVDQVLKEFGLS